MRDDLVDRAHEMHFVGAVLTAEEEDFPREFGPDHPGEVRRTVARIEAADVGIGLFESGELRTRQRQVAHDVQRMAATGRPSRNDRDDDLGHETDEALYFQDVQPTRSARLDGIRSTVGALRPVRVPVPVPAPDALVTTRAEGPATVPCRRPVSGEQYAADVARHPGM